MSKKIRIALSFTSLIALILIRMYQQNLFYDPFLKYFANDSPIKMVPEYETYKLMGSMVFRFNLNTLLSLLIIYVAFLNKSYTIEAAKIYAGIGLIGLFLYFYIIGNVLPEGEMICFYIRRILIQPLMLLIFLPAFYFIQEKEKTL